ncbi:nitroreductase family protein [Sinanaerobacter chloroacetimidivorans]|uniref:Nitroreductase family protein n=1 Tax=Sinanaerobacter chloroacetimidivorans TaxID=2818044 RepID=A0A8J8AZA1_9FIRM|nr:nitroreductase family protein [Sinanaerobacter chloroacetimidivorans]MBR0596303.1 nitroreductase family protein [Sinanaerobacter chloroacetimidivorans]
MVTIDSDKCIGCQRCIFVCPFTVLEVKDGKPSIHPEKQCLNCMHCAAVCPEKALGLDSEKGTLPGELPLLPENFSGMLEDFLFLRRSYRHFKPEPVPKEELEHALHVAAWAPSAKNQHPTKWIVINQVDKIQEIMHLILQYIEKTGISPEVAKEYEHGNNVVMGTANTIIMSYTGPNAINPPVDSALALYTAELILQSKGIGTCWAGYLTRLSNQIPEVRELLQLPEGCQICSALMVGYPENETYIHIPNRKKKPAIRWIE